MIEGKKLASMEVSNYCKIFTLIEFLVVAFNPCCSCLKIKGKHWECLE